MSEKKCANCGEYDELGSITDEHIVCEHCGKCYCCGDLICHVCCESLFKKISIKNRGYLKSHIRKNVGLVNHNKDGVVVKALCREHYVPKSMKRSQFKKLERNKRAKDRKIKKID